VIASDLVTIPIEPRDGCRRYRSGDQRRAIKETRSCIPQLHGNTETRKHSDAADAEIPILDEIPTASLSRKRSRQDGTIFEWGGTAKWQKKLNDW
jgi:hypothetical protein